MSLRRSPFSDPRARGRGGFTLIEALVTMALMLIVLPVVMRGMSVSQTAALRAKRMAEAASLAQSLLNELITSPDPSTYPSLGDFGPEWPDYTWSIANIYESELTVTQFTINVNWNERGHARTFSISTFIADPVQ